MGERIVRVSRRIQVVQTPTGNMAIATPVAQQLLSNGVISGEIGGHLHATDAATVKAAMMASAGICDFCSTPGAAHVHAVPDFEMPHGAGRSTDGWAACDACDTLICGNKRAALLERSTAGMAFPKFSRAAIAELHGQFWQGIEDRGTALGIAAAVGEFVEDRLPDGVRVTISQRDRRVEAVARLSGLTPEEIEAAILGELTGAAMAKLAAWRKTFGKADPRSLMDLMGDVVRKPLADVLPHWQRALDARFTALEQLAKLMQSQRDRSVYFPEPTDLNDPAAVRAVAQTAKRAADLADLGFGEDLKLLRVAQAYSFNAETIAAIREASHSLPHDAPLSSVETPSASAGWFWFADPLPIKASSVISDLVHGLLWGWTDDGAVVFSAYVKDEKGVTGMTKGTPAPSTRWFWPAHLSFHDMVAYNGSLWERDYGGAAELAVMGKDLTLVCVSELSLFFMMACLWFRQTVPGEVKTRREPILTVEAGHVERHARKRYARDHQLTEPPTVQVVALRRTVRVTTADAPADRQAGAREYHCRWIVKGHPRLQACGPARKDRKLIWIEAHPAGPEDKPLRVREKVYAVVR